MARRRVRVVVLSAVVSGAVVAGTAVAAVVAVPAPALAGSSETGLARLPLHLRVELPVVTVSIGQAPATVGPTRPPVARPVRAVRPERSQSRSATAAAGRSVAHPVAVTAPGLISVVPVGPLPSALRPRVATEAVRERLGVLASPARSVPAPPVGFWFAVVLLVLLLGSATYLVGRRPSYKVAVSITNR